MKKTIHDMTIGDIREAVRALHGRGLLHSKSVDVDRLAYLLLIGSGSAQIGSRSSLDDAEEALRTASEPIWGVVGERYDPMSVRAPEPTDESARCLYDILLAVRGRIRMARDHVVHLRELAAITGLDPSYLRRLVRAGELVRVGCQSRAPIDRISAEKLMRARHVRPFSVSAA